MCGKNKTLPSVVVLKLVKGPVPTELIAATSISYCVDGFNPVTSNTLVLSLVIVSTLIESLFNSLYLIT